MMADYQRKRLRIFPFWLPQGAVLFHSHGRFGYAGFSMRTLDA